MTRHKFIVTRTSDDLINPADAAAALRVSVQTLSRWVRDGKMPATATADGKRVFSRAAIREIAGGYDDLLTTPEVAKLLRVDPNSVQNWASSGNLTSILLPSGVHYRFPRAIIQELTKGQDDLMTPGEAASLLRVQRQILSLWAKQGRIEPITLPGGGRRYPRAAVQALIN
jgi:excisionase family DNA binding protein